MRAKNRTVAPEPSKDVNQCEASTNSDTIEGLCQLVAARIVVLSSEIALIRERLFGAAFGMPEAESHPSSLNGVQGTLTDAAVQLDDLSQRASAINASIHG